MGKVIFMHYDISETIAIDGEELLSGSVELIQDSTGELYNQATSTVLGRVPIALCLLLMIVIAIFKVM